MGPYANHTRGRALANADLIPGVIIKYFNSSITAGILAVLFFAAAHFSVTAYHHYLNDWENIDALQMRLKIARQQQSETQHRHQLLLQAKAFQDLASALKMEQKNWSVYDIQIEEPVSRAELTQILNQCQNSASYYFKPIAFHAKTADSPENQKAQAAAPHKGDTLPDSPGDIFLTLRGAFLVREE
jgi:hypothetical protein